MERDTGKVPPALQTRPEQDTSFSNVVAAFYLLYRGESIGISDIITYCEVFGIYDEQRFLTLIKIAEQTVMSIKNSK